MLLEWIAACNNFISSRTSRFIVSYLEFEDILLVWSGNHSDNCVHISYDVMQWLLE